MYLCVEYSMRVELGRATSCFAPTLDHLIRSESLSHCGHHYSAPLLYIYRPRCGSTAVGVQGKIALFGRRKESHCETQDARTIRKIVSLTITRPGFCRSESADARVLINKVRVEACKASSQWKIRLGRLHCPLPCQKSNSSTHNRVAMSVPLNATVAGIESDPTITTSRSCIRPILPVHHWAWKAPKSLWPQRCRLGISRKAIISVK
jgi:hypothetical protein